MKKQILLLIPAYNEEKNIKQILTKCMNSSFMPYMDILVVNDGSSDNTKQAVQEMGVKVISQVYNMGYGAALQTGYKYAAERDYEYVIQMDADGQHDVANIGIVHKKLTNDFDENGSLPDIVIGSRYLEGGVSFSMSKIRLMAVKLFRLTIKLTTGKKITDPTSGLQGLNRKAFCHYSKFNQFDIRYPDINMIMQMLFLGFRIEEVPAIMYQRLEGLPMHSGIIKPAKYMVLMMISSLIVLMRYQGKYIKKNKADKKAAPPPHI